MKLWDYICSKSITLCAIGIGAIFIGTVMCTASLSISLIFCTELFVIILVMLWLLISWYLDNKRIKKLEQTIFQLKDKYLLAEVLPRPKNAIEQIYFNIVKTVSRSAISTANQAMRDKDEYCEYVEAWIHEIKTPLTACSLIIANDMDVQKIRRELKRANNLTKSILYYARMKSSEKDIIIKKVKISDVLNQAVQSQMELLISANISIEIKGDFEVYTDDKSVCFIIKQLLINCAKYCKGCNVKITAEGGQVTVKDNGIGIPKHEIERVTDRGFTGTNGRKINSSTGMGLYIVKGLCSKLSITLDIDSKQNEYTIISLKFDSLTKL